MPPGKRPLSLTIHDNGATKRRKRPDCAGHGCGNCPDCDLLYKYMPEGSLHPRQEEADEDEQSESEESNTQDNGERYLRGDASEHANHGSSEEDEYFSSESEETDDGRACRWDYPAIPSKLDTKGKLLHRIDDWKRQAQAPGRGIEWPESSVLPSRRARRLIAGLRITIEECVEEHLEKLAALILRRKSRQWTWDFSIDLRKLLDDIDDEIDDATEQNDPCDLNKLLWDIDEDYGGRWLYDFLRSRKIQLPRKEVAIIRREWVRRSEVVIQAEQQSLAEHESSMLRSDGSYGIVNAEIKVRCRMRSLMSFEELYLQKLRQKYGLIAPQQHNAGVQQFSDTPIRFKEEKFYI
ncbi:hypothetical protein K402DRAFT_421859 [Aulographum hederae CBS 113979]|uniref:Uncharacterized protein n=1 Tax=Aulographum hederae CBS 113979 TaxID=1176131 RepID=A0A6G1GXW0_9PEZI|nr:hypothetical protein K402DRAFT_421859 [Aulographum hederae CBS 113979]